MPEKESEKFEGNFGTVAIIIKSVGRRRKDLDIEILDHKDLDHNLSVTASLWGRIQVNCSLIHWS